MSTKGDRAHDFTVRLAVGICAYKVVAVLGVKADGRENQPPDHRRRIGRENLHLTRVTRQPVFWHNGLRDISGESTYSAAPQTSHGFR